MLKTQIEQLAFCAYPFQRLKIDSEGDCTFCCSHTRKCLGNILNSTLEKVWFSPLALEIRSEVLQNRLHSTCNIESCPFFYRQGNLEGIRRSFYQKQYPVSLELDLPMQHCNIGGLKPTKDTACIMCERGMTFQSQKDRLNEICVVLRPYVRFLKHVHIQGVAEPFWKNRIFEIIDSLGLEPYQNQIIISTTTNGTVLNKLAIDKWLSFPKTSTTFSLDAASPETYKKIRRLNVYNKVIESLMTFAEKRTSNQVLQIHNNINLLNIHEVEGMVEIAAQANVNEINFNPTYNLEKYSVNPENVHLFKEAQEKIVSMASRLNVHATFLRNLTLDFLNE